MDVWETLHVMYIVCCLPFGRFTGTEPIFNLPKFTNTTLIYVYTVLLITEAHVRGATHSHCV